MDLDTGDEYFSYSPQRHRVAVEIKQDLIQRLQVTVRADYRESRYKDANTQIDFDQSVTAKRHDTRWTAAARVSFQPIEFGAVFLDYQHADNNSNFERYRYTSGQVSLGIDYQF